MIGSLEELESNQTIDNSSERGWVDDARALEVFERRPIVTEAEQVTRV